MNKSFLKIAIFFLLFNVQSNCSSETPSKEKFLEINLRVIRMQTNGLISGEMDATKVSLYNFIANACETHSQEGVNLIKLLIQKKADPNRLDTFQKKNKYTTGTALEMANAMSAKDPNNKTLNEIIRILNGSTSK